MHTSITMNMNMTQRFMHSKPTIASGGRHCRSLHIVNQSIKPNSNTPLTATTCCSNNRITESVSNNNQINNSRRQAMATLIATTTTMLTIPPPPSLAVQGLTAGRIPGVTGPDKDGNYLYTRPEGKSGGHGVGWSEIQRYSFKIASPAWEEVPVSIADLGGTEIDVKFSKEDAGTFAVVVAPVLRFLDVGYNANIKITEIGPPDKIISGFAPELFGKPLDDDSVIATEQAMHDGIPYYYWEVKPHHLVTATAVRNRVYILYTTSSSRQWRRGENDLRLTQKSFIVPI